MKETDFSSLDAAAIALARKYPEAEIVNRVRKTLAEHVPATDDSVAAAIAAAAFAPPEPTRKRIIGLAAIYERQIGKGK